MIREPPRAGPSSLVTMGGSWPARRKNSNRSCRSQGTSNTIPTKSGRRSSTSPAALAAAQPARRTLPPSASRTARNHDLWERDTGRAVANAIVWQSRDRADICNRLKADGLAELFAKRPGWSSTPIFPAPRSSICSTRFLAFAPGRNRRHPVRHRRYYLIWRLTGGRVHATDSATPAGR